MSEQDRMMTEETTVTPERLAAAGIGREAAVQRGRFHHRKTWWILLIAVLALVLIVVIAAFLLTREEGVTDSLGSDYIAVIDVNGEISSSDATYDHAWTLNTLDELIADSGNRALVVRFNTPGGSVYSSDELYEKLEEYGETGRPLYAYFQSEAASGGYYAAMACDKIYANRNCWTGSIGVRISTIYDITGLLEDLGIKAQTIDSGANKAMGSMTEELTEEQQAILQSLVDEAYNQFIGIVVDGREMSEEEVRAAADGRIYTASQAKALGLIDEVCNEKTFFTEIREEKTLQDSTIQYLEPEESFSLLSFLLSKLSVEQSSSELSEYNQLLEFAEKGSQLSVEYKAEIKQ